MICESEMSLEVDYAW